MEGLTAIGLLAGGVGVLKRKKWAPPLMLVAQGMMIYSVINSPGYFIQRGEWPLVAMFILLLVLGLIAVVRAARSK